MPGEPIPDEIHELADARLAARVARDWPTADRLRAEIEAAGWIVTDQAHSYRLSPAHPADIVDADLPRYGSSQTVPSRLEEAEVGIASFIVVATDRPDQLEGCLAGLTRSVSADVQIVIVANDPSPEQETALRRLEDRLAGERGTTESADSPAIEIVWTSARLGHAAALNVGLRRVAAPIVTLLDDSVEVVGDIVSPIVASLADPTVAISGAWGLASADLRQFAPASAGDVTAIDGRCQAFRRSDFIERGPFDEHFTIPAHLDAWWSLVLRDEEDELPPRRAVALELPVALRKTAAASSARPDAQTDADSRLARRNRYRIIDRFNGRLDLAAAPEPRR